MKFLVKMVGAAAAISLAVTTANALVDQSAATKDQSRWSDAFGAEMTVAPAALAAGKADRLPDAMSCGSAAWPYIAAECLASAGVVVKKADRLVALDDTSLANTTVLVKTPALPPARTASR